MTINWDDLHSQVDWKINTENVTYYEPPIYGIWMGESWLFLSTGEIFNTYYFKVAKAQLRYMDSWKAYYRGSIVNPKVALIDENGEPKFLEDNNDD